MNEDKDSPIERSIKELETGEKNLRFSRLLAICENVFGEYRTSGSHHIFKTPWQGDPRINLQKLKGNFARAVSSPPSASMSAKVKRGQEE